LASFAVLWLLAACSRPEQPPFEVRNELDQLVVDFFSPAEPGKLKEVVAEREARGGVVGATRQFLAQAFPQEIPQASVIDYFERIGGRCHTIEENVRSVVCEYCRNRNLGWMSYLETFYRTIEILWIVEIIDTDAPQSPDEIPVTDALAYSVATGAHSSNDHSDPAIKPDICDNAKFLYESHQGRDLEGDPYGYGELMQRHWLYEQPD